MTDIEIVEFLNHKKNNNVQIQTCHFPKEVKEFLLDKFPDSRSLKEAYYRYAYDISEIPKCPECGNLCRFNGKPRLVYLSFCSNECKHKSNLVGIHMKRTCLRKYGVESAAKLEITKEKAKATCMKRYGVQYALQAEVVKEKSRKTCLTRYGVDNYGKTEKSKKERHTPEILKRQVESRRKTCMERYGVDNHMKLQKYKDIISKALKNLNNKEEVINKRRQTKIDRYGTISYHNINKMKDTCRKRYGNDYFLGSELWKEKYEKACKEKYGTSNYANSIEGRKNLSEKLSNPEVQLKTLNTKIKNGSIGKTISNQEQYVVDMIKAKGYDVKQQYMSKKYPYKADMYLPELDLYIECNFYWTHGGHPYDEKSLEDIDIINKWKSKNTIFYNNAIRNWTISDMNKRNIAKLNGLNFIELWTFEEAKKFIDTL